MDANRTDLLSELARDAALERSDFIVRATEQLQRFLDANSSRLSELGGMTLIDDDPDYLSIAPDLTFRSRARYLDDATGEWVSETEVIESAAELIELYNPADIFQAFAEAAREGAGLEPEPTGADEMLNVAGIGPDETVAPDADGAYAAAADDWAAGQPIEADDEQSAAHKLYDLALTFQERSQLSEARLIEQFQLASSALAGKLGDIIVIDDDDERLTFTSAGQLSAEVIAEGETEWRKLVTPEEIVEFYDPTDVFGDVADAIAEGWPDVAPEMDDEADDEEPVEDEAPVEEEPGKHDR